MSSSLLVNSTSGSMMEMLGTSDRLMMDHLEPPFHVGHDAELGEMSEPEPAVVGRKMVGGKGRMMRLAPS